MSKTVFVITTGSYSDYRVQCACPTKKDAQRLAKRLANEEDGWYSDARVEQIALMAGDTEKVTVYSSTVVLLDDGGEVDDYADSKDMWPFEGELAPVVWRWIRAPIYQNRGGRLDVRGTDEVLVGKVFSEKRAQLKADIALAKKREWQGRVPA